MVSPYRSKNFSSFRTSPLKMGGRRPGTLARRSYGSGVNWLLLSLAAMGVAAAIFFVVMAIYLIISAFTMSRYLTALEGVEPNRIVDKNGELVAELFARKTGSLKVGQIPPQLKSAFLFVEDDGFYEHGAVHWPSVARAFFVNIISFGYRQGASTITQQLARILMERREKTLFRKAKEVSLAYYLENHLSKEEILTAYMNLVYLGHGSYGVENASAFYFRKKIGELNFVQNLTLACLPSAPEHYSPLKHPDFLEKKMDLVFQRMEEEGVAPIKRFDYELQKLNMLQSMNRSPGESVFSSRFDLAPFVTESIRMKIRQIFGQEFEFGAGLTVETTLDRRLQKIATEESTKFILKAAARYPPVKMVNGKVISDHDPSSALRSAYIRLSLGPILFGYPEAHSDQPHLQTASVGIDPATGEVRFLVGGTRFTSRNQLNRAVQMRRQTGSAIKPVIYSAAIESGTVTAADFLDDTPLYMAEAKKNPNDPGYWLPENITSVYEGRISVRDALARSKNVPAIRLAMMVGMDRLSEQFRKFFFSSDGEYQNRFRNDYTIAIGSMEFSPLEMASAFSAFGDNGVIHRPFLLRRILDHDGDVVYDGTGKDEFDLKLPLERRAIPGDVAQVMVSLMRDSGAHGGTGMGGDFIGKTGTSNDNKDAWFVGVVPGLSAAVWVGYDEPLYSMRYATGASVAGPLWGDIVSRGFSPKGGFAFSPGAVERVICVDSGKLANRSCPRKRTEYFMQEHQVNEQCEQHKDGPESRQDPNGWSLNSDSDFN